MSLPVSPNGRNVAVVAGAELQLWKLTSAGTLTEATPLGAVQFDPLENGAVVAFNSDGRILAAAGTNYTIQLWQVSPLTTGPVRTLTGHRNLINTIAFHPKRLEFASGAYDRNVLLWDRSSGERRVLSGQEVRGIEARSWPPAAKTRGADCSLPNGSLGLTVPSHRWANRRCERSIATFLRRCF